MRQIIIFMCQYSTYRGSKDDDDNFLSFYETSFTHKITSIELNDLIRNLDLSKSKAETFASVLLTVESSRRKCPSDFISHMSSAVRLFL